MFKRAFLLLIFLAGTAVAAPAAVRFPLDPFRFLLHFLEARPLPYGADQPREEAAQPIALEAEAISFSAARAGEGALLKWDLPQPAEVASLIIEGSEDGSHFTDLESLESTEAGVLDVFYDAAPKDRRHYRLIANYKNGQQKITPVNTLPPSAVFSAEVHLENDPILIVTGQERIELYDMQGRLITTAHPVAGKCMLDLHGLARGPYLARSGAHRQVVFY